MSIGIFLGQESVVDNVNVAGSAVTEVVLGGARQPPHMTSMFPNNAPYYYPSTHFSVIFIFYAIQLKHTLVFVYKEPSLLC